MGEIKICCASCKHKGKGFESRDEDGINHCSLLNREDETKCIVRNHQKWELEVRHD